VKKAATQPLTGLWCDLLSWGFGRNETATGAI